MTHHNTPMVIAFRVLGEAEDYFARLGGSARFIGFHDYYIPALVYILLAERFYGDNRLAILRDLLPGQIWAKYDTLLAKLRAMVPVDVPLNVDFFEDYVYKIATNLARRRQKTYLLEWLLFMRKTRQILDDRSLDRPFESFIPPVSDSWTRSHAASN